MTPTRTLDELERYYTNLHSEAERLSSTIRGQFERQRMREFLAQYLPSAPAKIADIGGGPGVHATWLTQEGYEVELLDRVERHVDEARAAGISATLGDARKLPWKAESFDAVLMAGPMYHLSVRDHRILALQEAARVLRPGGLLLVVAINRTASLVGSAIANTLYQRQNIVRAILANGYSDENDRMPNTTYHTVTQLRGELSEVMPTVSIHGLTGPGGWLAVLVDSYFSDSDLPVSLTEHDPLQTALASSRMADELPELAHASSLLLGVARRV
ncbi:class I SAM-dependent methyltransferase [Kribbella sp. CA-253562]|uniref:class I SAM-dependent methyltransferase n=1 Tax=Kribbella sp. CA-253562 TaxID=3239942 RepID=UPI003D933E4F